MPPGEARATVVIWSLMAAVVLVVGIRAAIALAAAIVGVVVFRAIVERVRELRPFDGVPQPRGA